MWSGVSSACGPTHIQSPELSGNRSAANTFAGAASPRVCHSCAVFASVAGTPAMSSPPPDRTKASMAPACTLRAARSDSPSTTSTSALSRSNGCWASGAVTIALSPRSAKASLSGTRSTSPVRSTTRNGAAKPTLVRANSARSHLVRIRITSCAFGRAVEVLASTSRAIGLSPLPARDRAEEEPGPGPEKVRRRTAVSPREYPLGSDRQKWVGHTILARSPHRPRAAVPRAVALGSGPEGA